MNENKTVKAILFDMEGSLIHEHEALSWTEDLLAALKNHPVKLAVLTDLTEEKGRELLAEAGNDPSAFDILISTTHYDEAFEKTAEAFGITTDEILFCTASAVGIKLASRKGMTSVAARARFSKEFYKKAGASYVLDTLATLPDLLN